MYIRTYKVYKNALFLGFEETFCVVENWDNWDSFMRGERKNIFG